MSRILIFALLASLVSACFFSPVPPRNNEDFGEEDPGFVLMHLDSIVWAPNWSVTGGGERRPPIEASALGDGVLILARRSVVNGMQELSVFIKNPVAGEEVLLPFDEASVTFRNTANNCRYLSAQDGFIRITGFDRVDQTIQGEFQMEYLTEECGYTSLTNGSFSVRY
ncbi:MAG: hypothetical protein AAFQ98_12425 [Bacteroidota bacterium]